MEARQINISCPPDFSFAECLWFLNRKYDDCMHSIGNDAITKAVMIHDRPFLIRIHEGKSQLHVHILKGDPTPFEMHLTEDYVREWLDINRDLTPFYKLLKKDKRLAYMADAFYGLRLLGINDLFEALCWSIIGQQINLTFAFRLKRRLVETYGTCIAFEGEKYYLFPDPAILQNLTPEDLRPMQYSLKKAEYVIGVAKAFASGQLNRAMLTAAGSPEAQQKILTSIRGIGTWTANYTLMKALRVNNAIPHGDSGLLKALTDHHIIEQRNETAKIEAFFKKFKGWEAYLVFYLWRTISPKEVKPVVDTQRITPR